MAELAVRTGDGINSAMMGCAGMERPLFVWIRPMLRKPTHRHPVVMLPGRPLVQWPLLVAAALLAGVLLASGCSPLWVLPKRDDAERVRIPVDTVILRGYLFTPPNPEERYPAVIILADYGNGLQTAINGGRIFAESGLTALVLSMRGGLGTAGRNDCALRQPADTVRALEWLARRPQVDRERMGLFGFSQAGQVALLTAARSKMVQAVVAAAAPVDIDLWKATTGHAGIKIWIGNVCEAGTPRGRLRSPIQHVNGIDAPVLLIHGRDDARVPPSQSERFANAMAKAGKSVELRLIDGATHRFSASEFRQSWAWSVAFFNRHLK